MTKSDITVKDMGSKNITMGSNSSMLFYVPEVFKKNKTFEQTVLLAQEKTFVLSSVSYLQTNGYSICYKLK